MIGRIGGRKGMPPGLSSITFDSTRSVISHVAVFTILQQLLRIFHIADSSSSFPSALPPIAPTTSSPSIQDQSRSFITQPSAALPSFLPVTAPAPSNSSSLVPCPIRDRNTLLLQATTFADISIPALADIISWTSSSSTLSTRPPSRVRDRR